MKKKLFSLVIATLLLLVVAIPALAQTFFATIIVVPTITSPMIGIGVSVNNTYLASQGFINASGNNTRVLSAGAEIPRMVADDTTWFASPLTTGISQSFEYTFGNTSTSSFPIITGYGGNITTPDSTNLELGANCTLEIKGWLYTNNYPTFGGTSTNSTITGVSGTGWSDTANITDGNTATYGYYAATNGVWTDNVTFTQTTTLMKGASWWVDANLTHANINAYYEGAWHSLYNGVTASGAWVSATFADGQLRMVRQVNASFLSSATGVVAFHEFDIIVNNESYGIYVRQPDAFSIFNSGSGNVTASSENCTLTLAGVTSGEYRVEIKLE